MLRGIMKYSDIELSRVLKGLGAAKGETLLRIGSRVYP
jgi:hypothetical protein